jgi:hypothetical protein
MTASRIRVHGLPPCAQTDVGGNLRVAVGDALPLAALLRQLRGPAHHDRFKRSGDSAACSIVSHDCRCAYVSTRRL